MTTNYIDNTGLHLQTMTEIVTDLETKFKEVYGYDINLDANSPDKQMIEIFAQAKSDMLDIITQVYNSFSPTTAIGAALDSRVAINGIQRFGATYTRTEMTITTDRTVTLAGIDTAPNSPFTVADGAGNQFFLETTQTLSGAGAHTGIIFRAENPGLVATTIGTITTIVTVTLGVTAVNNPDYALTTGDDEETDAQLRQRREASVAIPSVGYLEGLTGALKAISGVTDAVVFENITSTTDSDGIPGHSIWAIVDGGTDEGIAAAIYQKRNAGCGMKGNEQVDVTQVNGTTFPVLFDRAILQDLYISLTITSTDSAHTPDDVYLAAQIADQIEYKIYEVADFTAITTLVKELDPLAVVTAGGVSDTAGSYVPYKYPGTIQKRWVINTSRINITVI